MCARLPYPAAGDHARTAVSVAHNCGMLCQNRPVAFADTASAEGRVEDTDLSLAAAAPDGGELPALGGADELLGGVAAGSLAAAVTGRGFEKVWARGWGGGQLRVSQGRCEAAATEGHYCLLPSRPRPLHWLWHVPGPHFR